METANLRTWATAWKKNDTEIQSSMRPIGIANPVAVVISKVACDQKKNQLYDIAKVEITP